VPMQGSAMTYAKAPVPFPGRRCDCGANRAPRDATF
jgi:hypothetical protein